MKLSQQAQAKKSNSTTEFLDAASWHINQTLSNCSAKLLVKILVPVLNLITQ